MKYSVTHFNPSLRNSMNEEHCIQSIISRQIYDSRGIPTIETDVILKNGLYGRATVPSGASTGSHEALELRDQEKSFNGKGISKALHYIKNDISDALLGFSVLNQRVIDSLLIQLDGTDNKSNLGANSILSVSLASARAAACYYQLPLFQYLGGNMLNLLPVPFVNVINGGKHSNSELAIQEFMIVPHGFTSFSYAMEATHNIFFTLKSLLDSKNFSVAVGDEGGFAPTLSKTTEALDLLMLSIQKSGYTPGKDVSIALDFASNEFYHKGFYTIDKQKFNTSQYIDYIKNLVHEYPIISIEDPLYEDDFKAWGILTESIKDTTQVVGDDLFVTQSQRIQKGIHYGAGNAVLIKMNQVGTLSEAYDAVRLAQSAGYHIMVSHRSGETEDTSVVDFCVGVGASQIKVGSISRSERVAKYNRLLRIEELLQGTAIYSQFSIKK